jgi:hypothetical protein
MHQVRSLILLLFIVNFNCSCFQRDTNPTQYRNLIQQPEGDFNITMDEIERDVHRLVFLAFMFSYFLSFF